MILLDASVVVDLWRRPGRVAAELLPFGQIVICGVTWAEMLQGARSANDVETIRIRLSHFEQVAIPDTIWPELGANLSKLRRAGITVPFPDVLLATVAIHHDLALWTLDKHFTLIQQHLTSLRLHVPST